MKKTILTFGLFSLMMVLTSFTSPEIGGGQTVNRVTEIGGGQTVNRVSDIGGGQTVNRVSDIGGGQTINRNR
jgi:hypothetical protein